MFEAGRHYLRPLKADGSTPEASDFLRSDNSWTNNMRNVSGHGETNSTACPGEAVMALLDDLQTEIHAGLDDEPTPTSRTGGTLTKKGPYGRETRRNTAIEYSWHAEAPESGWRLAGYEYCFEGWHKPSSSINVTYLSSYSGGAHERH